jgi:hypothetical protein
MKPERRWCGAALLFAVGCLDQQSIRVLPDGRVIGPEVTPPDCDEAAFCATFDQPSPGGRAGDLDDAEWSIARVGGFNNPTQGQLNQWMPAQSDACGTARSGILPGEDFFFCEGGGIDSMHLVNAYDDGGGFTIHSMRMRRPFDFEGRTGVISFQVDAKSTVYLGHGIWWNFMITDEPVPAPYQDAGAMALFARRGIGIEFQGGFICDSYDGTLNQVSSIFYERDYQIVSQLLPADSECFQTAAGVMNDVEIHIGESSIEVWVSDAGRPETLRKVASLDETSAPDMFPLEFTRGYVHFQHSHYNAAKSEIIPAYASYHWDNIVFDGPELPLPRAYVVADSSTDGADGSLNTGYQLGETPLALALNGVDLEDAGSAVLTLNTVFFEPTSTFSYRLNGNAWHEVPYYFPTESAAERAVLVPIDLAELAQGDNTLELTGQPHWAGGLVVSQIELTINPE